MYILEQCRACGHKSRMTTTRVCVKCGASLPSIPAHIQAEIDSLNDLVASCNFMIEIEDRFGVEISDEALKYLRDANAICSFILNGLPIQLGCPTRQDILTALREAAEKHLGIKDSSPRSDLLERFRNNLDKPKTAHVPSR